MKNLIFVVIAAMMIGMVGPKVINSMSSDEGTYADKTAYELLDQGSRKFKNPSSIRITEGIIYYDKEGKEIFLARVSAENGFGGHANKVYSFKSDGSVLPWDDDKGDFMLKFTEGTKVDTEKVNKKWVKAHP